MTQVTIIDYGSGNLHSIAKAFEKVANGKKIVVSSDARDIEKASHIVLPGVGAFNDCVNGLEKLDGVKAALQKNVIEKKKPFLGVCVGMQMLADIGLENGEHKGFGWISGRVMPINPKDKSLKIPHMGWNELKINRTHPILDGIENGDHVYFVHSYHFCCNDGSNVLSSVEYGGDVVAVIANDNIVAAQFHPEKSQEVGLKFISNFLEGFNYETS